MSDEKRIKRLVHGRPHRLLVRFARGFGDICREEIEALLATPVEAAKFPTKVTGEANAVVVEEISYRGALELAWRSLTAREILLEIERVPKITNRSMLDKALAEATLAFHFPPGSAVAVRARSTSSRLYHEGMIRERADMALVAAGFKAAKTADAEALLDIRMAKDELLLSVAVPGVEAFRRGYKPEMSGEASVREDLAAAACRVLGAFKPSLILNPFAGSGTLGAEALLWSLGAPGAIFRDDWAALRAPACPDKTVANFALKLAERSRERGPAPRLRFIEKDAAAAGALRKFGSALADSLAAKGYPKPEIDVAEQDFFTWDLEPMLRDERTMLVVNPPYGVRIGNRKSAQKTYRMLGDRLTEVLGKGAAVSGFIFGFQEDLAAVAKQLAKVAKVDAERKFVHGGLDLTLLVFS